MFIKIKQNITNLLVYFSNKFQIDLVYITKGGFWLSLRQVISNLASFVLAIYYARYLSKETYGLYNFIHATLGILMIFSLPGMNLSISQAVARGKEKMLITGFFQKIKFSLLGSIGALGLAVYYFYIGNFQIFGVYIVITFLFPFMYSPNLYDAYLQGKKLFKVESIFESLYQIINMIVLIVVLIWTSNLTILIASFAITLVLVRMSSYYWTIGHFPPNNQDDSKAINYGKHLSLMSVFGTLSSYLDRLLVFMFIGPVELAIYSFALLPIEKTALLFDNIQALGMPKFSKLTLGHLKYTLIRRFIQALFLGTGLGLIYIFISPYVFRLFFPSYTNAILISQILGITLVMKLPTMVLAAAGQAKMTLFSKKYLYFSSFIPQILFMVMLFVFTNIWGIWGMVWARVVNSILLIIVGIINLAVLFRNHKEDIV